jgi:hypothetical protein
VRFLGLVLRYWSCLFALLLGLFATAVAALLLATHANNVELGMLPWWQGAGALVPLLILGLLGILAGALALLQKARPLLVLYTIVALGMIVYGYFISMAYHFDGAPGFFNALWLALGALLAALGSFTQFTGDRRA